MPVLAKGKNMAKTVALTGAGEGGGGNRVTGTLTRTLDFLKDVRGEMRKVVTPSRKEVQATTTVVIVAVFAFAAYFYVVDGVIGYGIQHLLHSLGGAQ
jgi:preprotein translocase subunit SecE